MRDRLATDGLLRVATVVEIPGAMASERWAAVWFCPTCSRGASTFHPTFAAADRFLELVLRDPRCGRCRARAGVRA